MIDFRGDFSDMQVGEQRRIYVHGEGKIRFRVRQFRDSQPGRGFLPDEAQWSLIANGGGVTIKAWPKDWIGHSGSIIINSRDDDCACACSIKVQG